MKREQWIEAVLSRLREDQLQRWLEAYPGCGGRIRDSNRTLLNFCSNDYLDLCRHPEVVQASAKALLEFGAGAAASRLLTGTLPPHEQLERRLAHFKGYPASLVFGSGYLANAGIISSLVGRGDVIFADRLSHASILDAAALSRARLVRFRHNDPGHLEDLLRRGGRTGRTLVVTESVFSMDGDLAPLPDLADVALRYGAMMMVDEAHATGVFGPAGSGLVRKHGLEGKVNVSMGTLSKALGGYGGFAACSTAVRELLVHRARAFIYTAAPPPSVIGSSLGALDVLAHSPDLGSELLGRAHRFRERLRASGLDVMGSQSQIIPVKVGDNARSLSLARRLRAQDVLAAAIRPPTVPAGTARLRLSLTLAHSEEDLARAASVIIASARAEGLA